MPQPSPLDGVRVVTLAVNLPGPVAAARLRDLGARVIKVEPPGGDPLRAASEQAYQDLVEGQEVVALDLRSDDEREALHRLLGDADLLLTSVRPSSLARLGLAWSVLHDRHPGLSQVAIVGSTGSAAEVAGHDLTYQAASGTLAPPALPTVLVADLSAAERAVTEALAALLLRAPAGEGVYREVSLARACGDMARPVRWRLTAPGGPLGGGLPAYGLYRASDGWVALAALEPHFRRRMQDLLAVDGSAEAYAETFATRSARAWEEWGRAHDVPLAAVR